MNIWQTVLEGTAHRMLARAKTAPKATNIDNLYYDLVTGKDMDLIIKAMKKIAVDSDTPFIFRDAQNLKNIKYLVILGLLKKPIAKNYKSPIIPEHSFNHTTLGIAIGSALAAANNDGVDTRVMWSVGEGYRHTKLPRYDLEVAYGLPLSISEKNPFSDRRPI